MKREGEGEGSGGPMRELDSVVKPLSKFWSLGDCLAMLKESSGRSLRRLTKHGSNDMAHPATSI